MPQKFVLLENHESLRDKLKVLLQNDKAISDISETNYRHSGLSVQLKTDIALLNVSVNSDSHIDSIRTIRSLFPTIKVLVMSSVSKSDVSLVAVLDAGASGFIMIEAECNELLAALTKIGQGEVYIDNHYTHSKNKDGKSFVKASEVLLSNKELDVLVLIAEGFTNAQIANKLVTSIRTIETRRKNLLLKTGTNNTATLIKYAVRSGLVP